MAESENAAVSGEPLSNGADTAPAAGMLSQYVKDLSFENPNAPAIYQSQTPPQVDVQFNIGSGQVGDDVYEVALKIEVKATIDSQTAFLVDLTYGGLFALRNVPADQIDGFLLAEAPRIMFPFARRVLADAVRDGGFLPLLLEPIDFHGLYMARTMEMQAQAAGVETGNA